MELLLWQEKHDLPSKVSAAQEVTLFSPKMCVRGCLIFLGVYVKACMRKICSTSVHKHIAKAIPSTAIFLGQCDRRWAVAWALAVDSQLKSDER